MSSGLGNQIKKNKYLIIKILIISLQLGLPFYRLHVILMAVNYWLIIPTSATSHVLVTEIYDPDYIFFLFVFLDQDSTRLSYSYQCNNYKSNLKVIKK